MEEINKNDSPQDINEIVKYLQLIAAQKEAENRKKIKKINRELKGLNNEVQQRKKDLKISAFLLAASASTLYCFLYKNGLIGAYGVDLSMLSEIVNKVATSNKQEIITMINNNKEAVSEIYLSSIATYLLSVPLFANIYSKYKKKNKELKNKSDELYDELNTPSTDYLNIVETQARIK